MEVTVSSRQVAKIVLVAALVIGAIYVAYLIRDVLVLIVVAALFALAIAPVVDWLHQRRVPRAAAILLVYMGIAGAIFGIGLLVVPPLIDGVDDLGRDLPGHVSDLRENETFEEFDDRYNITEELTKQARELPDRLGDAAGTLRDVTVGVFASFIQLFAILVIAFFFLMDGGRALRFGYAQLPPSRARRVEAVAHEISTAISGWVLGIFVVGILAGSVTYLTLSLLDVPFALPLAIMIAFFGLIPLVGATIGGIVVGIVVAITTGPLALLVWGVVLFFYQQFENHVIMPVVYGRTVEIHPLYVIVAILVGASLLGILGALIAIPAAAATQAAVRDIWRHRGGEPLGPEDPEPLPG